MNSASAGSRRGQGVVHVLRRPNMNKTASPRLIAKQRRTPCARSFAISVNFSFVVLSCLFLAALRLHVCLSDGIHALSGFLSALHVLLSCIRLQLQPVALEEPLSGGG